MIRYSLTFTLLLLATALKADKTIVGLSQDQISIGAQYNGSILLLFGAIELEHYSSEDPVDVIVTVAGPEAPLQYGENHATGASG